MRFSSHLLFCSSSRALPRPFIFLFFFFLIKVASLLFRGQTGFYPGVYFLFTQHRDTQRLPQLTRGKCLVREASRLLIKTRKLTMQIHSLKIVCDRKSQSEYSNTVPQETVRGSNSPATIYRHMFKGMARGNTAAFWPCWSPGAHGLHAPLGNLSATMRSPARQKESKDVTKAKPPTSAPSPQPVATSEKKLGVGFKSP